MTFLKLFLSAIYFPILIYTVFFARRREGITDRLVNFIPAKNTIHSYNEFNAHNQLYHFYINLFGNFLLLIPFSFLLVSVYEQQKYRVLLWCVLMSFTIELLQFIFRKGVADIDDILLNVLGALAGIIFYSAINTARSRA